MNTHLKQPVKTLYLSCVLALLFMSCNSDPRTDKSSTQESTQSKFSADLVRANQLTKLVFDYVEQMEMGKITKEEMNKLSNPYKLELESLRSQLTKQELTYNDSIRKVFGNIMVDNVMRWRKEKGLILPDGSLPPEKGN